MTEAGTSGMETASVPTASARGPEFAIPYWGSAVEMMEVLELVPKDTIRAHVERFPLVHVEEAYARLRDGRLDGRAVIVSQG